MCLKEAAAPVGKGRLATGDSARSRAAAGSGERLDAGGRGRSPGRKAAGRGGGAGVRSVTVATGGRDTGGHTGGGRKRSDSLSGGALGTFAIAFTRTAAIATSLVVDGSRGLGRAL